MIEGDGRIALLMDLRLWGWDMDGGVYWMAGFDVLSTECVGSAVW